MNFAAPEDPTSRQVEITSVFHTFPNFLEVTRDVDSPMDIKRKLDERGGPIILNYRLIKDFTKGRADRSDWKLTAANHFYLYEVGS